jgi:hypothetical protein
MTTWHADTGQRQLDVGTLLSIYYAPWGPGISHQLVGGESVLLHFTSGATARFEIVAVSEDAVIIQTSDGTQWRAVEPTPQQLIFAVDTGGAPTSHWLVKERI